jgi:hypothetical protein
MINLETKNKENINRFNFLSLNHYTLSATVEIYIKIVI